MELDPADDRQLANRPERRTEHPCHAGTHVSHRKAFRRSAIGTVWGRAGRLDKGVPGLHGSARSGHNAGMALLRYTAITSLDGYVNDAEGGFSWAAPSDELHEVVNDPGAGGRHLPARPPDVRDDALLGDRPR